MAKKYNSMAEVTAAAEAQREKKKYNNMSEVSAAARSQTIQRNPISYEKAPLPYEERTPLSPSAREVLESAARDVVGTPVIPGTRDAQNAGLKWAVEKTKKFEPLAPYKDAGFVRGYAQGVDAAKLSELTEPVGPLSAASRAGQRTGTVPGTSPLMHNTENDRAAAAIYAANVVPPELQQEFSGVEKTYGTYQNIPAANRPVQEIRTEIEGLKAMRDAAAPGSQKWRFAQQYIDKFEDLIEESNPALEAAGFLANAFGSGVAATVMNGPGGLVTAIGDAATGGQLFDDYQKIAQYMNSTPGAAELIYAPGVPNFWHLSQEIGVPVASIQKFRDSSQASYMYSHGYEKFDTVDEQFKEKWGQTAYSTGQMLSRALLTYSMLGPGSAGGASSSFLVNFRNALKGGSGVLNAAKTAAQGSFKAFLTPQNIMNSALMAADVGGSTLVTTAAERGYDSTNYLYAASQAFSETLTEALGGFNSISDLTATLSATGGNWWKNVAGNLVSGALGVLEEGGEELVNVPLSGFFEKLFLDEDKAWTGEGGVFDFGEMKSAFAAGSRSALIFSVFGSTLAVPQIIQETNDVNTGYQFLVGLNDQLPTKYRIDIPSAASVTMDDIEMYTEKIAEVARRYAYEEYLPQRVQDIEQQLEAVPEMERPEAPADVTPDTFAEYKEEARRVMEAYGEELDKTISPEEDAAGALVQRAQASGAFGDSGRKAFRAAASQVYEEDTVAFTSEFQRVYQAGLTGADMDAVQTQVLDSAQKYAAYTAGKNDAKNGVAQAEIRAYNEKNNMEGVANERTEEVYLRNGSERNGSSDSGRQVPGMEEGTRRTQSRKARAGSADGGTAALTFGDEVSASSFGISGGSTKKTIRTVVSGDTEATRAARQIAKEYGLRVTFFSGDNLHIKQTGKDGRVHDVSARAYITGDRVFIRVDHAEFTAEQLMRHEAAHARIAKGEISVEAVKQRINNEFTEDAAARLLQEYADGYLGSGMTAEEILEELICDSEADMNVFARTRYETVEQILQPVVREASAETRTEATRGPPVDGKASRDLDERSRALRKGEMVNEFRDKVNWPAYFDKLKSAEFNSDYFDDGDRTTMRLNGQLLILEMQRNGEFSVVAVQEVKYETDADNYERNAGVYAGEEVARERTGDNAGRNRAGEGRESRSREGVGNPAHRTDSEGSGESRTADAEVTGKAHRELDAVDVGYDAESVSVYPEGKFSRETWVRSEYVTARETAAEEMAKALDISKKKALDYIDSVNSIAKMIADDRTRLDYLASPDRSSFVKNAEYGGSIDFSTICKKRRLFTGTFEAIQRLLPNTALTAEEILEIRRMMDERGYEVSCGLCYVEGSRANMGQYTKQFIERYKATNPEYVPNMAEMNTATGQERLRLEHPEVYEAYEYFMNHYGRLKPTDKALFASQQKPKMYQLATEYQGEILNKFKKIGNVDQKNANGGLRLQSFSDFEIIHLIDCMQVIMDMAQVGLAGQAYTKVPDFAWALGDTGLKINLSLIAKGIDSKGRLVLDEKEGMRLEDAMALRNRYSKNVGTIVVVFTDNQLKAAMADERIDFIIPFHRSQWKTEQYNIMGLPKNAKDFTSWQNEAYIDPVYNANGKKQRPDNYMPNTYWDFSKSGKENATAYLQMCAANNRRPKFHFLLADNKDGSYSLQPDGSTDGYWKLLIDFKMYDNEGNGSPQMPVRPDFNMEEAERMLNEYTGGHSKFPAAQDVVDEFVEKYTQEHEGVHFSQELDNIKKLRKEYEKLQNRSAADLERLRKRSETLQNRMQRRIDALTQEKREAVERAKIAGQMAQGKRDAAELRKANDRAEKTAARYEEQIENLKRQNREAVAEARLAGQMAQGKRDAEKLRAANERTKNVRADRDEKIAALKQRNKERAKAQQESRTKTGMRSKIQRHVKELTNTFLKGTDKKHIPQNLREAVRELLESINLESNYEIEFSGGDYKRVKPGESRYAEPTKRTQAFRRIKELLKEDEARGGTISAAPDLMDEDGVMDKVLALEDKRLVDMSLEELTDVWKAIRMIEGAIRSANKVFAQTKFQGIMEAAYALQKDNKGNKLPAEYFGLSQLKDVFLTGMMTPETYFYFLGDSGREIFRALRNAQDQNTMIIKDAIDFASSLEVVARELEKEVHDVTLGGKKVKMSTAQIMDLYASMQRKQAMNHILGGGILPDTVRAEKSLKYDSPVEPIRVTMEELQNAVSLLTDAQIAAADALQLYASTELADVGNKASMAVYNYEKFGEETYWPIRVVPTTVKQETEKETAVTSVAGKSHAKNTQDNARNAIRVGSIFDTFANHAAEMATYAAYLGVLEDVNRIRNFQFKDGNGDRIGSVGEILDSVFGKRGNKGRGTAYLSKLIADLSVGIKGAESDIMSRVIGNVRAASVGANIRVVIQQPTSGLRALDMIDAKYLLQPGNPKAGWEKAKKYAPIAVWKDWGHFEIGTGRQVKDLMFGSSGALNTIREKSMALAGWMDSVTWGALWNAVEAETKDKYKALSVGSKAYYDAVAKRFTEIVDRTQVVDGILQRSQLMRSPNELTKLSTAFKGEPTKQYNMMLQAMYDLRNAEGKEAKAAARKRAGRTVFSLALSGVVNAAMQSFIDALRDDDAEKRYWKKWIEQFSGITGEEETFFEGVRNFTGSNLGDTMNLAQYAPYASDLISLVQGYSVGRTDWDSISKVISAATSLIKAIGGNDKSTWYNATANLLAESSRLLGIPVANLKRDIMAAVMLAVNEFGNVRVRYSVMKALKNLNFSGNSATFLDIAYDALEAGDIDTFRLIRRELMTAQGLSGDKVDSGMKSRYNKAKKKDPKYTLPDAAKKASGIADGYKVEDEESFGADDLTPSQYGVYAETRGKSYGEYEDAITDLDAFEDFDNETKNKVLSSAMKLAKAVALEEATDGEHPVDTKWMLWATGGDGYGVDESEAILFKLAYDTVAGDTDPETGKTVSGSKQENVIEQALEWMPGLSETELKYLMSNYWKTE